MVATLESATVAAFRRYLSQAAGESGASVELIGGPFGNRRFEFPADSRCDDRLAIPVNRDESLFAVYAANGQSRLGLFIGLDEKDRLPFLASSRVPIAGGSGGSV